MHQGDFVRHIKAQGFRLISSGKLFCRYGRGDNTHRGKWEKEIRIFRSCITFDVANMTNHGSGRFVTTEMLDRKDYTWEELISEYDRVWFTLSLNYR